MSGKTQYRLVAGILFAGLLLSLAIVIFNMLTVGKIEPSDILRVLWGAILVGMFTEGSKTAKRLLTISASLTCLQLVARGFETGAGGITVEAGVLFVAGVAYLFAACSLMFSTELATAMQNRLRESATKTEKEEREYLLGIGQDPDSEWRPGFGPRKEE